MVRVLFLFSILFLFTGFANAEANDVNIVSNNEKGVFQQTATFFGADHRGIKAQMQSGTPSSNSNITLIDSLYDDLWTLPETITDKTVSIASQPANLTFLLLAAGGGIALRQGGGDDKIAEDIENNRFFQDKWSDEGLAIVGGPGFHFAAAGLWYALADNANNDLNQSRAWTMIEALSVTGAVTLGLKAAINDETPNEQPWAWPSGHTASSFTVAAVLDEYYGAGVGIPAYLGAGVVGWRMMDSGDHWASDVLFGAILGYIVGHQVAGDNNMQIAGFEIKPYISETGQDVAGLSLVKLW